MPEATSCHAGVTGTVTNGAPAVTFPPVPACGPPYSGSTGISGTYYTYDPSTGVLTTDSHNTGTVTLAGGTYCFKSITLQSHGVVQVSSPVNLYLTDGFDASGGSVVNNTGIASNLKLFDSLVSTYKNNGTPDNPIQLSGGQQTAMAVYAPNAAVTFSGKNHFFGSVVAGYTDDSGGTPIPYDRSVGNGFGSRAQPSRGAEGLKVSER